MIFFFFRDHYSVACRKNQLKNVALKLKSLPTPALVDNIFSPSLLSLQLFSQELNDLARDLNLSKKSFELLASRLKERNLLKLGTLITFYWKHHEGFLPYFTQENEIVCCNNVEGLLKKLGVFGYNSNDW